MPQPFKILILNGPNLNLLGIREQDIYGVTSFEHYLEGLEKRFPSVAFVYRQSNIEGELIDHLHAFGFEVDGVIMNLGGYTHTSVALRDAVAAIDAPVIEVHISNIYAREPFRQHSITAGACRGIICGLGLDVYNLAVLFFANKV